MSKPLPVIAVLLATVLAHGPMAHAEPAQERDGGRDQLLRLAFSDIADRVAPSVVEVIGETTGFGIVLSEDAEVLTCNRLLGNMAVPGKAVKVRLADGRELEALVLGRHGPLDVALLAIGTPLDGKRELPEGLSPARQGDSESAGVGDFTLTAGPAGYLSAGMIGALGREIGRERRIPTQGVFGVFGAPNLSPLRPYPDLIQHDSGFETGWFGAPLVDREGRLIGVNVAAFYRGSVFATPLHRIQEVLEVLRKGGNLPPPISYAPAAPAPDDILEHLDEAIDRMLDEEDSPLRKLLLEIFNGGPDHPVRKALEERSRRARSAEAKEHGYAPGSSRGVARIGAAAAAMLAPWAAAPEDKEETEDDHEDMGGWLGIRAGRAPSNTGTLVIVVRKVYPDSPAEQAGLEEGDHIVAIDGETPASVADLGRRLRGRAPGTKIVLEVARIVVTKQTEEVFATEARTLTLEAVLGERPEDATPGFLGVGLTDGTEGPRVGYIFPDGPAARAGILRDDQILNVGRRRTPDLDAFADAMERTRAGQKVRVTLLRGDGKVSVEVELGKRE